MMYKILIWLVLIVICALLVKAFIAVVASIVPFALGAILAYPFGYIHRATREDDDDIK